MAGERTLLIGSDCKLTDEEIVRILNVASRAKEYGWSDVLITFAEAVIIKVHTTIKEQLPQGGGPAAGRGRGPRVGGGLFIGGGGATKEF